MFRSKNKPAPQRNGLTLCLSGVELLQKENIKRYFVEIKNLVSCPDNIYRELYLTTLYRLAEFCQTMPFLENDFNNDCGFLERQLKLAVAALKLRRGSLFPKNAGTERISSEESQWTYALFSGSLFKDLYKLSGNRTVQLYESNGEPSGLWAPVLGPLYGQAAYYSTNFSDEIPVVSQDILMTIFSGQVLPSVSIRWLFTNVGLFGQWWDVIIHKVSQENVIENIIREAAKKSGIILFEQSTTNTNFMPVPDLDYRAEFTKCITHEIEKNQERIFKISSGLFVSTEVVNDFLTTNNIASKNIFIQSLEKEKWLVLTNRDCYHKLSPKKFEDRRVLQGVIINIDFLPEELQKLQVNEYFQKPLPL
jgi:hypothetical protein